MARKSEIHPEVRLKQDKRVTYGGDRYHPWCSAVTLRGGKCTYYARWSVAGSQGLCTLHAVKALDRLSEN